MLCPYERRHCPGDGRDYAHYRPFKRARLCADSLLEATGVIFPLREGVTLRGETFTYHLIDVERGIAIRSPPSRFVTVDRNELRESTEVVRCEDCGVSHPSIRLCTRGGHPATGDVDGVVLCNDCRTARGRLPSSRSGTSDAQSCDLRSPRFPEGVSSIEAICP